MKRVLQLAVLALAAAQPALADNNALVCHKGTDTLSIAQSAVQAHVDHGDTLGSCPAKPTSVVLLRCDSVDGGQVVVSFSISPLLEPVEPVDQPEPLPQVLGANCAAWVAGLMNQGWELKFVTAGSTVETVEGGSGAVTEYVFVTPKPAVFVVP